LSLKDQMRKDFEKIITNTDEFGETFTVIRNGSASHEVVGILANNVLQVKLDADVKPGDLLQNKSTLRQVTVQNTMQDLVWLNVYCR